MCEQTNHKGKDDVQEYNPAFIEWIGTMHDCNLTFYKMHGKYFVRSKSSLTRKRVKRAACFKKTREFAAKLGRASSIASSVYKQLPEGWRLHSLYRKLTGVGFQLLKTADHSDEEVITHLWQYLRKLGYKAEIDYEQVQPSTAHYQEPVASNKRILRKKRAQRISLKRKYWNTTDVRPEIVDCPTIHKQLFLIPYHALLQPASNLSG